MKRIKLSIHPLVRLVARQWLASGLRRLFSNPPTTTPQPRDPPCINRPTLRKELRLRLSVSLQPRAHGIKESIWVAKYHCMPQGVMQPWIHMWIILAALAVSMAPFGLYSSTGKRMETFQVAPTRSGVSNIYFERSSDF